MAQFDLIMDGDGSAPELIGKRIHQVDYVKLTALPSGTQAGNPSVAFVIPLEDGSYVFAETTLALFLMAADMFKAKYGDPRE